MMKGQKKKVFSKMKKMALASVVVCAYEIMSSLHDSSLIRFFPVCYIDKHFVVSNPDD